jgi:thioredoxin-like negative regulator of GroEL
MRAPGLALLVAITFAPAARAHGSGGRPVGGSLPWERDFGQALKKARAERRPVMIDFWAEWCHYCHELERTTYADPRVLRLAADFVPATVDTEGSTRDRALSDRYDVRELPTILFVTPEGRSILRVEGFQGPDPFADTLKKAKGLAAEVMAMEVLVAAHPNDPQALASLGSHLFDQAEAEECLDLLSRAARHDGQTSAVDRKRTRLQIAVLLARKKQFGKAEAAYAEARALSAEPPPEPRLLLGLAQGFLTGGRKDTAQRVVDEIASCCAADPIAAEARDLLAAAGAAGK